MNRVTACKACNHHQSNRTLLLRGLHPSRRLRLVSDGRKRADRVSPRGPKAGKLVQ